jgi:hypothetical protein
MLVQTFRDSVCRVVSAMDSHGRIFGFLDPETLRGPPKNYPTIFFPAVSNGERVMKLSVAVEGIFMRMRDILLPRNTARCVCRYQRVKWCNMCSSHTCFARDDRTIGAAILHQCL